MSRPKVEISKHARDRIRRRVLPFHRNGMRYSERFITKLVEEAYDNNSWTRNAPKWMKGGNRIPKGITVRYIRTSFGGEDFIIVVNRGPEELKVITVVGRTDGLSRIAV